MSKLYFSLLLFFILSCLSQSVRSEPCDLTNFFFDPTFIQTRTGNLKGCCRKINLNDPDNPNRTASVLSWLGVPFAEPPIGPRRFQPSKLVSSWIEPRNATEFSKKCIQATPGPGQSEDCLYLNIYAPLKKQPLPVTELLPIYVYIHGGTFKSGSGSDVDPTYVVAYSNIIVITINYRLGAFGFMHLPEAGIQGNMGFLDQHIALRWIYENAVSFRGDSKKITLGGQSAGSFSAHYHLIYPPSWPYFRNLILESGSIFTSKMMFMASEIAAKRTDDIFEALNCSSKMGSVERSKCIQDIKPFKLVQAWNDYQENNILNGNSYGSYLNPVFHLVLNHNDFNMTVQEYFDTGFYKSDVNLLLGNVKDEGSGILPLKLIADDQKLDYDEFTKSLDEFYLYFVQFPSPSTREFKQSIMNTYTRPNQTDYLDSMVEILSEHIYICPSIDFTAFYANNNQQMRVYRYSYDYRSEQSSTPAILGVTHSEDLPFWFSEVNQSQKNHLFCNSNFIVI